MKKEKDEELQPEEEVDEKAQVIFARLVAHPPRERIIEVTNLPLDKLRPLTWMKTFNAEAGMLFNDIYTAQGKYVEIYKARRQVILNWYKDYFTDFKDTKGLEKVADLQEQLDNLPAIEWYDNWETVKLNLNLLSNEWIYTYCQSRRSLNGEFMRHTVVLTQDQIAANQDAEKDPMQTFNQ